MGTSLASNEPPDFFRWVFLRGYIYQGNQRTIGALKAVITEKIQANTQEKYAHVSNNFAFNNAFK